VNRSKRIGVALVAVAALAGGFLMTRGPNEAPAEASTTTVEATRDTDTVTRRTLQQTEEFKGALGYGDQFSLPGTSAGTVSWVPEKGALLQPGDLLYRVDERPTFWTHGDVPMYRELSSGSEGTDVEQLQRHLQEGEYLAADVEIDGKFGGTTRNAVKAWQDDHDLKKTGRIDATQLLFLPYESVRVAAVPRVGAAAVGGIIEVTEPDLFVTVDVSARKKRAFEGRPVIEVETADGSRFAATVESITAQQSQDAFGGQNYRIRLQLEADGDIEPGEATIEAIDVIAENVLTVPARALVALVEGGYAVEVVQSDGTTAYRAVAIGEFADGWVEVTGDIAAGDQVAVPE
jgi:peptidoglycan hydrolase-like protein with peptidoglycan-binding domain